MPSLLESILNVISNTLLKDGVHRKIYSIGTPLHHYADVRPFEKENNQLACIFLYLIPYFLSNHLAVKSIGIEYDGTTRNLVKNVVKTTLITVGGLFVFYLAVLCQLNFTHTVMEGFRTGILYAYALAILPLTIGITVGNALNVYVSSKTRSIWAGLCTAVLWGVWTLYSTGVMTNYIIF